MNRNSFLKSIMYINPLIRPDFKVFSSWDRSVIYFAIPKNANSFTKALFLYNNLALKDFDPTCDTALSYLKRNPKKRKFVFAQRREIFSDCSRRDKIVIIRDPAQRLVSCFLDKLAKNGVLSEEAKNFCKDYKKIFSKNLYTDEICFERFVEYVSNIPDFIRDPHFKSQSSFLAGIKINRYFDFEKPTEIKAYLQSKGFYELPVSKVNSDVVKSTKYYSELSSYSGAKSITELNKFDFYPSFFSFYNEASFHLFTSSYGHDLQLWNRVVKRQPISHWRAQFPFIK